MTIRNVLGNIRNNIGARIMFAGVLLLHEKHKRRLNLALALAKAFERECPEAFRAAVDRGAQVSVSDDGVLIAEKVMEARAEEYAARTVH